MTYYERNKDAVKLKRRARYAANREAELAAMKAARAANPAPHQARTAAWAARNRDKMRAYQSEYVKRNRPLWTEQTARYRASKRQATPTWADQQKIAELYVAARRMTELTGVEHHVDHIVPLKSKIVCGLHVETNLQVLPALDNKKKSNRLWPDMP